MSKIGKVILWIVVAVIVIGGIWWWMASKGNSPATTANLSGTPSTSTSTPATSVASTSYPQGDSDQSINQDMTTLTAQLNGLNSDNASVTQSMNDQPVAQAE
jgi:cytoskeletal protein RodZ